MSSSDINYIYKLVIGDESHDGHGMTATYRIRSNMPSSAVCAAYTAMKEKTGVDFAAGGNVCGEYDETRLTEDVVRRLRACGVHAPDAEYWLNTDDFVELLLAFIMAGDKELELAVINDEPTLLSAVGFGWGYGLFST